MKCENWDKYSEEATTALMKKNTVSNVFGMEISEGVSEKEEEKLQSLIHVCP